MKRKRPIYILASIILVFVCIIGFSLTYTNVFCDPIMEGPQKGVDVTPLYKANVNLENAHNLNEIVDLAKFNQIDFVNDTTLSMYSSDNSIQLFVNYWTKIEHADSDFKNVCESIVYQKESTKYGGEPGNRYCISKVRKMRASTDELCLPRGEYESFVVFQKRNLVITETTESPDVLNKNKMIIVFAEALNKKK
jgi:hypothetical protein